MSPEPTAMQFLQIVAAANQAQRAKSSGIQPYANVREFAEAYRPSPGRGEPVNFAKYNHLRAIYEDVARSIVLMAGAQSGKTLLMLWLLLWHAVKRWGGHIGAYYPDDRTAGKNSDRFEMFAKSIDRFRNLIGSGDETRGGKDNVSVRSLGPSTLYFQSVAGKSTTESTPMSVILFDELRSMDYRLVRRAEERLSGQDILDRAMVKASTAQLPNSNIHAAFLMGDQRFFHTDCKCADGVALSEVFPDCVVDLNGATPELRRKVEHASTMAGLPYCGVSDEVRAEAGDGMLMCPRCGMWIFRPRDGWWEQHNPGAAIHSWQFSQMHSPTVTAPELAMKIHRPASGIVDLQSMFNDVAGMPYLGRDGQPLSRDLLAGMVRTDLVWPATQSPTWRRANMKNCAMGIDHMKGFSLVWIKHWAPNGKARTVHVEVAFGEDPWVRCAVLMDDYDVQCCVIEEGPNYNEALRFADTFPGRVWLLHYSSSPTGPMMRWGQRSKAIRGEEVKTTRYTVIGNQDRLMQWMCGRMLKRENEWPHPRGLIQVLPRSQGKVKLTPDMNAGPHEPAFALEDVAFPDLEAVAFSKKYREADGEDAEGGGRYDLEFVPIGRDPHSALACMMADLALSKIQGGMLPEQDYAQPFSEEGGIEVDGQTMTEEELIRRIQAMGFE